MSSVLDSVRLAGRDGHTGARTPVEVLLARHPEVEANVAKRFVGSGESPYTERGVGQKRRLETCIVAWEPTCVRTSPRERARSVAEAVARVGGKSAHVDADLAEIDFGAAEGLTYGEARSRGVEMDLLGGPAEGAPFKDGETWHAFLSRVAAAARRAEECGPRVAIVTHGGVVRALLTLWLGLPHEAAWRFAVANGAVATLTLADGRGTLRSFGVEPGRCEWESLA